MVLVLILHQQVVQRQHNVLKYVIGVIVHVPKSTLMDAVVAQDVQWCAKKIAGITQQSYFVEDDKYRKSFFVHSPYIIEYTNIIIDS